MLESCGVHRLGHGVSRAGARNQDASIAIFLLGLAAHDWTPETRKPSRK